MGCVVLLSNRLVSVVVGLQFVSADRACVASLQPSLDAPGQEKE